MSHLSNRKGLILSVPYRAAAACLSSIVFFSIALPQAPKGASGASPVFSKCWEYKAVPDLKVNAVADAENVYFLDSENKLHGVDITLGTKLWSTDVGGSVISDLLIADDSILVVTGSTATPGVGSKSILWSISRQTGITEWHIDIALSAAVWLGSVGKNVVAVGSDGAASAVDAGKGELTWTAKVGSNVTSDPYFDEIGAAFGIARNEVVRIAGQDGSVRSLWKSKHIPTAVFVDTRGRMLVGDERGNLVSVSADGSRVWSFKNGARISRVLAYGGEYIAASNDNFVYDISRGGDVRWKRRLSGRVAGTPVVLGNNLIVSIVGAGAVYVLDLKNGKISNRVETGDETTAGIAARLNGQGFVMTGVRAVSYFDRGKCPAK